MSNFPLEMGGMSQEFFNLEYHIPPPNFQYDDVPRNFRNMKHGITHATFA